MKTLLEELGVYQSVSPLDMPLQIMGFVKRKGITQTKHTATQRYYWLLRTGNNDWNPQIVVDVRYWKGDNARPIKYNVKGMFRNVTYSHMKDMLITTDPTEAIDFINEEISKCQQH